ncbi:tyrosine-type recombinase/integrase [Nocardiopsis sp. FR26]|uniref:tyrosine-type recombinase/integrase n=1 Tax=Nocardiopsis sp. FR26 TaxID=2605987 RepID=UPI00135680AC|nr:tyrosine-type recombinase/integrase [Nocardiopsis sp. FR26]
METTYDIKLWGLRKYKGKTKTTYTVRWMVSGKLWPETFPTKALADSFRADLKGALNRGEAFRVDTGRPVSWESKAEAMTWYTFVCQYLDEHWQGASANHRKDRARILTDATEALWSSENGKPDRNLIRIALQRWAYNTVHRETEMPSDVEAVIKWVQHHTIPLKELAQAPMIRSVLKRISQKKDGTPAAPTSAVKAKRVLSHALDYAVECGHLDANPISLVKWKAPKTSQELDRTSVPNPKQVRALIDAIAQHKPSGPRLRAFFSTLYLTALRPEEAVNLKWSDVHLPPRRWDPDTQQWLNPDLEEEWGEIVVREVAPDVGKRWTDSGEQRDRRQPKGRAVGEKRPVPCPPQLTRVLRRHRDEFGVGPDGLVFFGIHGRQLATCVYQDAWNRARRQVFTKAQQGTPLARTPYDLRHACVSIWLSQGIYPAQVAAWAGHSQEVLLRVYAKCISGNEERDRHRAAAGFTGF